MRRSAISDECFYIVDGIYADEFDGEGEVERDPLYA